MCVCFFLFFRGGVWIKQNGKKQAVLHEAERIAAAAAVAAAFDGQRRAAAAAAAAAVARDRSRYYRWHDGHWYEEDRLKRQS